MHIKQVNPGEYKQYLSQLTKAEAERALRYAVRVPDLEWLELVNLIDDVEVQHRDLIARYEEALMESYATAAAELDGLTLTPRQAQRRTRLARMRAQRKQS